MTNPLLQAWTTPFQIAPFAEIEDEHFAPALVEALQRPYGRNRRDRGQSRRANV